MLYPALASLLFNDSMTNTVSRTIQDLPGLQ